MNHSIFLHDEDLPYLFASRRHTNVECISHLHSSMEVVIVNDGVLQMCIDGQSYSISEGEAAFVGAYELHEFHSMYPNKCHVLMFSKDLAVQFYDFLKYNKPETHVFSLSEPCRILANRILPKEENVADYIHAMAVLSPILCEMYEKCGFTVRKTAFRDSFSNALEYMDRHFSEDISLQSTAYAVGIHPVTLSRKFSELGKTNFNAHLNYLRCNHAANLIKSTNLTFTEIAFSSGFGSIRSFNRAFYRMFGVTPTVFQTLPTV